MTWKGFLAAVFALPALIALAGVGILAYKIGETWKPHNTDFLVGGVAASCVSGVLLFGLIVVGVFALAALRRSQSSTPQYPPQPPVVQIHRPPSWAEQPPMIEDKNAGSWQTTGQGYDLWENEPRMPTEE